MRTAEFITVEFYYETPLVQQQNLFGAEVISSGHLGPVTNGQARVEPVAMLTITAQQQLTKLMRLRGKTHWGYTARA